MPRRYFALAALLVGLALFPFAHAQQELRIVDQVGLTRLQQRVTGKMQITVTLEKGEQSIDQSVLSNVDGVATDRPSQIVSDDQIRFRDVGPGTWMVRGSERRVRLVEAVRQ